MALGTITPISSFVIGDRWTKVFSIVGPASYTTGGEVLTPAQLGFIADPELLITTDVSPVSGVEGAYDYAAQKLKLFAGAAETTAATNLSTSTFRVTAIGRYTA